MKQHIVLKQIFIPFLLLLFVTPTLNAQTKKIKRPKSSVGVSSVDNFVRESFDLYDKVYKYDGYAAAGTPLDDEDIDVLEEAMAEMTALSESAPDIINDLDGVGILKQGKATLQINKAKKTLKYSIKTTKELLLGQRERDTKEEEEESSNDSNHETDENSDSDNTIDNTSGDKEEIDNVSDGLEVYSKYDFVPGDKLLFYDDFANDFIGDFPAKWNTNGSGEVVTLNKANGRWFEFKQGYNTYVIPNLPSELPEDFTIEFDLITLGINAKTSGAAYLEVRLEDNNEFRTGNDFARVEIPFVQYVTPTFRVRNRIDGKNTITNNVKADIRKAVLNKPHVSIAVNKERFRVWINEKNVLIFLK